MDSHAWTDADSRKARAAWLEFCTQYGVTPEWAARCEEFVEMPEAELLKEARSLDFLVGARVCFGRRDIDDYDAVRDVLLARGYDLQTLLKFNYRRLTEEEQRLIGEALSSAFQQEAPGPSTNCQRGCGNAPYEDRGHVDPSDAIRVGDERMDGTKHDANDGSCRSSRMPE
jgi:hypothetical protein